MTEAGDISFVRTRPRIIGLTGKRGVGKSTIAGMLADLGFVRVHPLGGGKAAAVAYFQHLGADDDTSLRMAHGDLRDVPSDLLPGRATPRHFLEQLGKFWGTTLGPDWSLGLELDRALKSHRAVVVESVVYEQSVIRDRGGMIYRVERHVAGPAGLHSDEAQAAIDVDGTINNVGSLESLRATVEHLAR